MLNLSSYGGHPGFRITTKNEKFCKGPPNDSTHTQFWFNQIKSFIKPFINSYPLGSYVNFVQ